MQTLGTGMLLGCSAIEASLPMFKYSMYEWAVVKTNVSVIYEWALEQNFTVLDKCLTVIYEQPCLNFSLSVFNYFYEWPCKNSNFDGKRSNS